MARTSLFFRDGLTYNIHARGVLLKCKLLRNCVFDAGASFLATSADSIAPEYLLCLLNSHVISFFIKKFRNNTWHELNDIRQVPVVIPTAEQNKRMCDAATLAMSAKRHEFEGTVPANDLVARVRELEAALRAAAPGYLQPSAQGRILETPPTAWK
jgi:hypothetical protein